MNRLLQIGLIILTPFVVAAYCNLGTFVATDNAQKLDPQLAYEQGVDDIVVEYLILTPLCHRYPHPDADSHPNPHPNRAGLIRRIGCSRRRVGRRGTFIRQWTAAPCRRNRDRHRGCPQSHGRHAHPNAASAHANPCFADRHPNAPAPTDPHAGTTRTGPTDAKTAANSHSRPVGQFKNVSPLRRNIPLRTRGQYAYHLYDTGQ